MANNYLDDIRERQSLTPEKIYKNDECYGCFLDFIGKAQDALKYKKHPTKPIFIKVCKECWIKLNKIS